MFEERDVPPGDGYTFDRDEIHQVIGVDQRHPTIALHLLVRGRVADRTHWRSPEQMPPDRRLPFRGYSGRALAYPALLQGPHATMTAMRCGESFTAHDWG